MSRFNKPTTPTKVENLAGGEAYAQTPELELTSILLTSFANDQFYRDANSTFDRLKELIGKCDPEFVAKAAVYARTVFGMRSITHVVASELAKFIGGKVWAKKFYSAVVYRPDDMMEILSYHTSKNGKVTNAMKAGLAKAFDKFSKYQLAKYKGEGKGFKLIDVVNLVHPIPVEKNAEAIAALVKGDLKSFDTWESELSRAGQNVDSEDQREEVKKDVWVKMVTEKKLGYFALLRNLRNIMETAPEVLKNALEQLVNREAIKKSLVLPFRFITAFDEIAKLNMGQVTREVLMALSQAVEISLDNVPKFEGDTLVVLDVSQSMRDGDGKSSKIGAVFAAALVKRNNCDFLTFDEYARYVNINPMDSFTTIANSMRFEGGGTNFHKIFETANKRYDRIIILSDMQGWIGRTTPTREFHAYKVATQCSPFIYSFDLKGYGSLQFPENQVFAIAGFSDKVFDVMKLLEKDKKAMINEIKKITFD